MCVLSKKFNDSLSKILQVFIMKTCTISVSKNKLSCLQVLAILISSLVTPLPFEVGAVGATIYVPDDYPTIQYAIGNSTAGDTIILRAGQTNEGQVTVDEQLALQGENRETSIIDAMGSDWGVWISAEGVIISGLTVTNASISGICPYTNT